MGIFYLIKISTRTRSECLRIIATSHNGTLSIELMNIQEYHIYMGVKEENDNTTGKASGRKVDNRGEGI